MHKEKVRNLLSNFIVPADFPMDLRRYSRNIDWSSRIPSLGVGAGVEGDVVYVPGSYIPRSLHVNLSATLAGTEMNVGEFGFRTEGLEPLLMDLFGPKDPLKSDGIGKVKEMTEKENGDIAKEKMSIGLSTISDFLRKLYRQDASGGIKMDMFFRLMGKELFYTSLSGKPKEFGLGNLKESFASFFQPSFDPLHLNVSSVRTGAVLRDYHFPTIQGSPLRVTLSAVGVAGFKMDTKLNILELILQSSEIGGTFKICPSVSLKTSVFIGHDWNLFQNALTMDGQMSSSNGITVILKRIEEEVQFELELPNKMEIFSIKAAARLEKVIEGRSIVISAPSTERDERAEHKSCINTFEPVFGLKICYAVNIPDIFRSDALPLGKPTVAKLYVEKAHSSMKGYLVTATLKNKRGNKLLKLNIDAEGVPSPRKTEMALSYAREESSYIVSATLDSSGFTAGMWTTLTSKERYSAFETFVKFKAKGIDISHSIKMELNAKQEGAVEELVLNVSSGRSRRLASESEIVEAKVTKTPNGPAVSLDVTCRTKNSLMEYLELSFEGKFHLYVISYIFRLS